MHCGEADRMHMSKTTFKYNFWEARTWTYILRLSPTYWASFLHIRTHFYILKLSPTYWDLALHTGAWSYILRFSPTYWDLVLHTYKNCKIKLCIYKLLDVDWIHIQIIRRKNAGEFQAVRTNSNSQYLDKIHTNAT